MKFRASLLSLVFGAVALVTIALGLHTGCSTTAGTSPESAARRELIAQAAVVYATSRVLDNNPSYAPRIAQIAAEVRAISSGEAATTVDVVIALAKSKIDWTKLSPADTALVNLLLDAVAAELTARVGAGVLPPERALVVAKVAGWIENAAIAYAPPAAVTTSHPTANRGARITTQARVRSCAVGSVAGLLTACAGRPAYFFTSAG